MDASDFGVAWVRRLKRHSHYLRKEEPGTLQGKGEGRKSFRRGLKDWRNIVFGSHS